MDLAPRMDMGGGSSSGMPACQMNMLWNWDTVDACFLAESWQITSQGMFAGSCIGIILLVMALEFVRRAGREYDHLILTRWREVVNSKNEAAKTMNITSDGDSTSKSDKAQVDITKYGSRFDIFTAVSGLNLPAHRPIFKPTVFQQAIRALFYMIQFGGAYIVMLLLMSFNGYIFFCILIGGFLGFFFFGSDNIAFTAEQETPPNIDCC